MKCILCNKDIKRSIVWETNKICDCRLDTIKERYRNKHKKEPRITDIDFILYASQSYNGAVGLRKRKQNQIMENLKK